MDNKRRISIQIGPNKYPMTVDSHEEPLYREAGRMVNRRIVSYSTKYRGADLLPDDLLAMAALDLALGLHRRTQETDNTGAIQEVAQMVADLKQFLVE